MCSINKIYAPSNKMLIDVMGSNSIHHLNRSFVRSFICACWKQPVIMKWTINKCFIAVILQNRYIYTICNFERRVCSVIISCECKLFKFFEFSTTWRALFSLLNLVGRIQYSQSYHHCDALRYGRRVGELIIKRDTHAQ